MVEIISSNKFLVYHKNLEPHPENPERIEILLSSVDNVQLLEKYEPIDSAKIVHSDKYIERLKTICDNIYLDSDTYFTTTTILACELCLGLMEHAIENNQDHQFLLVRPPGHHAGINGKALNVKSQGFCIINNVAYLAKRLYDEGLNVCIIDIDAHHGNGTQEIFYDKDLLYISLHQRDLYPRTGFENEIGVRKGLGYNLNIPLEAYSGDGDLEQILDKLFDRLKDLALDYIIVSLGFDGYKGDELSLLQYTDHGFYYLYKKIKDIDVPSISVLEGGYNDDMGRLLRACLDALEDREPSVTIEKTGSKSDIEKIKKHIDSVLNIIK